MSDNAVFVICMTVFMLGMLAFAGLVAWLNSRNPSTGHRRPPTLLPPGHWGTYQPLPKGGITPKETPQVPPRGTHHPQGQPVDLRTVRPPQQPSAVQFPEAMSAGEASRILGSGGPSTAELIRSDRDGDDEVIA